MPREAPRPAAGAALRRIMALAPLDSDGVTKFETAIASAAHIRANSDIAIEGSTITGPRLIVSGWAAKVRNFSDGRRQFMSLILPGDLIGLSRRIGATALTNIVSLTDVTLCSAPALSISPAVEQAYAASEVLQEAYLYEQVARLGRLNARERVTSLMLELLERLQLNGMASDDAFDLPLTQEVLADATGLTSVHVNRMLKEARQAGDVEWRNGRVRLNKPGDLTRKIGRKAVRIADAARKA